MEFSLPGTPDSSKELATYLTLHLLTLSEDSLISYELPDDALGVLPDPDPTLYKDRNGTNDSLYIYLNCVNKSIDELSWGEKYLLSRGYMPGIFSAVGRQVISELLFELLTTTDKKETAENKGMRVVSGICVGKIVELDDIPGSISRQKLAYVDVGVLTGEDGKPFLDIEGNELRDIRQIVCGGTDVLLPGHQVLVALPGARLEDGKKVRSRHLNIRNDEGEIIRYNTDGVLLSHEEAFLAFKDFRDYFKDQVLILPKVPKQPESRYKGEDAFYPGKSMDDLRLVVRRKKGPLRDIFFHQSQTDLSAYLHDFFTSLEVALSSVTSLSAEDLQEISRQREAQTEDVAYLEKAVAAAYSALTPEAREFFAKAIEEGMARKRERTSLTDDQ